MDNSKQFNVTGMQGAADYVALLFDGRNWSESQIVMAVYELEKVKRHSKKLRLIEAVAFLKSFLEVL